MDFLDRRKRQAHRKRLMTGYFLVSIAIILGAYLLVSSAGGFGIDTKTGNVIVNSLLFLDSKPAGADIDINGKPRNSKTAARLILPAGNYSVTLKRDGYRDWSRSFTLTEHAISRYVYPFLFPVKPEPKSLKNYTLQPPTLTQSPDRRWLLVQTSSVGTPTFDEYDTSSLKLAPKVLSFPDNLLSGSTDIDSSYKVVEWSTDNKNLLIQHTFSGGSEFVVFNRASPTDSFNVNRTLNVKPTQVALRNKKIDQLYLFNENNGNLDIANVSSGQITPFLTQVLTFKPSGSNLVFYVTAHDTPSGDVTARIWDGNKSYPLYSYAKGSRYLLDLAQFQGDWYYIAGSDKSDRFNIYKNPLDGLRNTAIAKALPLTSLREIGADKLSFSTNTRFVEVQAGQSVAVYDFETQTRYHYVLDKPLAGELHWMDGHRLIGDSGNEIFVTDYDSTNQQILIPVSSANDIYFDPDYNHLISLTSAADGSFNLDNTDMRAGADLPRNP